MNDDEGMMPTTPPIDDVAEPDDDVSVINTSNKVYIARGVYCVMANFSKTCHCQNMGTRSSPTDEGYEALKELSREEDEDVEMVEVGILVFCN